jgi:hypothetical protein
MPPNSTTRSRAVSSTIWCPSRGEGPVTLSWFQNFRQLCIRYEKSAMLFQGFLHQGCSIVLLKQVLG